MKTALITGITGQDGAYLARTLLECHYKVVGIRRPGSTARLSRLEELGIAEDVEIRTGDLQEVSAIRRIIETVKPDEIYNLAAQSSIDASNSCPLYTADVNGTAVLRLLEAIRYAAPTAKVFQASSSEIFGIVSGGRQDEGTACCPRSVYGAAKLFAHNVARNYRQLYGMHISTGIMYNHTSPLQGEGFVAPKIINTLERIADGSSERLKLGSLDAQRDWGYAGDFTEAMHAMLQLPESGDYIVATGKTATVREFVEIAASCVDIAIHWSDNMLTGYDDSNNVVVTVDPALVRPPETGRLCGDAKKLYRATGWEPTFSLHELISYMMSTQKHRRSLLGRRFSGDKLSIWSD